MTAYAMSLLMNRKFIINLEIPCKLSDYIQPNLIDWSYNETYFKKLSQHNFFPGLNLEFVEHELTKIDFTKYKHNIDAIRYRSSLNLVRHLSLNKKHAIRINALGYAVEEFNIESR
jgi:hypothetical protein